MDRARVLEWIDQYEALMQENAKLKNEVIGLKAIVAAQESTIEELKSRPEVPPERARLEEKYKNLRFAGKCTTRQFTVAAHASLYPAGTIPRDYFELFNAYFAELEKPFGLMRDRTHVIGVSSRE